MENKEDKKIENDNEDQKKKLMYLASEMGKKVREESGIDELKNLLEKKEFPTAIENKAKKDTRLAKILVGGVERNVDKLEKDEKTLLWFGAIMRNDEKMIKALSEGTPADGGYLFPDEFRAEVIREIADRPSMRSLVTVIPMARDIMKIPGVANGPQITWTSENSVKSTTSIEFKEYTLTVYKMAALLYASDELIADSTFVDVIALIRTLFAERIQEEEDAVICHGSGTGRPTGLTNCSIAQVTSAAAALSFDDIIALIHGLPSKYRPNASFLMTNKSVQRLRLLKDGDSKYLWNESIAPGQPSTIYGYPVYENQNIGDSEIYFGDWKKVYYLGDRQQMTVETNRYSDTAWTKDQTCIRVVERIAGNCTLINAARRISGIS